MSANEFVKYEDDGSATITLAGKVEMDGVKITTISMREPTVRDQLAGEKAKGGDAEKEISIFASLCEQTPAFIESLSLRNYKRVQAAYVGFAD